MSSRELADKIKIITPFAAAVAELSESLDDLAALAGVPPKYPAMPIEIEA